ncbi:pyridoxamine 5'-phosphate oxidase family protein [Campylobacter lari]|uniref:pyridoxamine 5'-phosphate oxidase family protein n=1 Tax=Campylobacter lari TaxID=201 RepID=UPI00214A5A0D|nr:pyridoxamine 5'-phosphate oxidase family protein [Campylobacter lari]MCR2068640.1 pyridoxamine 5'-phosphate oxidase family protein [Campylobacter lari subsp. concheus]
MMKLINLYKNAKALWISSLNLNNQTICSYTPIIKNDFYIYISEIAEHFEGIKHNNKNIEIMFIEDEKDCMSIFARKRLKFRIECIEITKDNQLFEQVLNTY